MTHNRNLRTMISACAAVLALMLWANTSRAAMDYFLQIDGIDGQAAGYHKTLHYTGGKLETGALKPGTYKVTVLDQASKPIAPKKHTGWIEVVSYSYGVAAAPAKGNGASMASGGAITTTTTTSTTTNPAPKNKPFSIHKEVDAASPVMFSISPKDVDKNGMLDLAVTLTLN
jgi:hypothetical protein